MLTREQIYEMQMLRSCGTVVSNMIQLRQREQNIFSVLPIELIWEIHEKGQAPNSEFAEALRLAAASEEEDLNKLTAMLDKNPRLLLHAGNVLTRAGQTVIRVTLYEFFLGAGDPDATKRIEPYFAKFEGGETQKKMQLERYRPHIEALAKQLKLKQPAYDLKPLINLIKDSAAADITASLNNDMTHKSALSDALIQFREAVKPPKKITVGMHYAHYSTFIQGLDLLYQDDAFFSQYANYDKLALVCRQVIGYLQRGLPATDRFAFARSLQDKLRTLKFIDDNNNSFLDTSNGDVDFPDLGSKIIIWGKKRSAMRGNGVRFTNFITDKISNLTELLQPPSPKQSRWCAII